MATEEYSIGYEEGHQAGWNAAMESLPAPVQQEPVAAECNFVGTKEWGRCSIEHHNLVQSEPHKWPGYQTRLLYTSHQPAQQTPVAWVEGEEIYWHNAPDLNDWIRQNGQPLYTSPPTLSLAPVAEPRKQEQPVAWIEHYQGSIAYNPYREAAKQLPDGIRFDLYTSTAQRTWVGLTDEEIARVVSLAGFAPDWVEAHIAIQIVKTLEAKLKEKNT